MSAGMQEVKDTPVARRKWTVEEYERLIDAGILNEDDRIELIQGELVETPPISSGHSGHVNRLNRMLAKKFGERAVIAVQNPIQLDEESEPQPDFSLLKPRADDYTASHPTPADVFLLIEVAETSIDYDRQAKAKLYAQAQIPELWVVNLRDHNVELFREPSPEGYRAQIVLAHDAEVRPLAFPDVAIRVSEILRATRGGQNDSGSFYMI